MNIIICDKSFFRKSKRNYIKLRKELMFEFILCELEEILVVSVGRINFLYRGLIDCYRFEIDKCFVF